MSARVPPTPRVAPTAVALLGVGAVGRALLVRWPQVPATSALRLVYAGNSRTAVAASRGLDVAAVQARFADEARPASRLAPMALIDRVGAGGCIIDATGSDDVANCHRRWLAAGCTVVTANKAALGGPLAAYRRIATHGDRYGDSATVGAGLPLLSSLRALRAGGDRVHAIAGVLSGTLAWLFDRYDGSVPFSRLLAQARSLGYCEPDPRLDLSGGDVRRKLLILARTAGAALDESVVRVVSLVPSALATGTWEEACERIDELDESILRAWRSAREAGRRLRFIARWSADGGAHVGLESLAADDALLGGRGCDNRVAIWSCRYREQPLVVQGPGAGPAVTAAALLDDLLRLARPRAAAPTRTAA